MELCWAGDLRKPEGRKNQCADVLLRLLLEVMGAPFCWALRSVQNASQNWEDQQLRDALAINYLLPLLLGGPQKSEAESRDEMGTISRSPAQLQLRPQVCQVPTTNKQGYLAPRLLVLQRRAGLSSGLQGHKFLFLLDLLSSASPWVDSFRGVVKSQGHRLPRA